MGDTFQALSEEPREASGLNGRALAEYYVSRVALASEGLYQPEPTLLLRWLRSQHPRIIRTLDWCLAEPEQNPLGLEFGAVLWTFWTFSGYLMEGQEKLTALLRQDTNPSPSWARGRVCLGLGKLSLLLGDYEQAVIHYDEAHKIGTLLHDKVLRADSLIGKGEAVLSSDGFPDSLSYFEHALHLLEALDEQRGVSKCYRAMGTVRSRMADYAAALDLLDTALTIASNAGDEGSRADCYLDLGIVALHQKNLTEADEHFSKARRIAQGLSDPIREASACTNLSYLADLQGNNSAAREFALTAVSMYHALGMARHEAYSLINLAASQIEDKAYGVAYQTLQQSIERLTSFRKPDRFAFLLAIEECARIFFLIRQFAPAIKLNGAASRLRDLSGSPMTADLLTGYHLRLDEMRHAVGTNDFENLWVQGKAMTDDEVISFISMPHSPLI